MKKLTILLLLLPISLTAQEKYFHELKGMEDSTGTTHLFYRMFESYQSSCSYIDTPSSPYTHIDNSIYQFDTKLQVAEKRFGAGRGMRIDCVPNTWEIDNFLFPTSSLDSVLVIRTTGGGLQFGKYLEYADKKTLDLGLGNPGGIISDPFRNKIILNTPFTEVLIKRYNYFENLKKSFVFTPEVYPDHYSYQELEDSLLIDFTVFAISPFEEGVYFGLKNNAFVISMDFGATYDSVAASPIQQYDLFNLGTTSFSPDSLSIYFDINSEYYLLQEKPEDWKFRNISNEFQMEDFTPDQDTAGVFFFSKNDSLFEVSNYGDSKVLFDIFESEITGLYKKPNSDILYVLTTDELFEVNTETKVVTSLKKLPVSNEEPKETPTSIKLHQNYPNPFNPSTTISFELDRPTEVILTIFDALGRVVSVLVEEQRTTGLHEISFDASNLSSGIYFYRLEAGVFSETKRFTLIK